MKDYYCSNCGKVGLVKLEAPSKAVHTCPKCNRSLLVKISHDDEVIVRAKPTEKERQVFKKAAET